MKYQDWIATAADLLSTMMESRNGGLAPGRAWDTAVEALLAHSVDAPKPPPATDERWHAYVVAGVKALGEVGAGEALTAALRPDDVAASLALEAARFADAMLEAAERQALTGRGAPVEGA